MLAVSAVPQRRFGLSALRACGRYHRRRGMDTASLFTLLGRLAGYAGILSIGRMQTPLLGLILPRDRGIEADAVLHLRDLRAHRSGRDVSRAPGARTQSCVKPRAHAARSSSASTSLRLPPLHSRARRPANGRGQRSSPERRADAGRVPSTSPVGQYPRRPGGSLSSVLLIAGAGRAEVAASQAQSVHRGIGVGASGVNRRQAGEIGLAQTPDARSA